MTLTQICPPHGVEPNMTNVGTIAGHVVLFQTTPSQGDVTRKIFSPTSRLLVSRA